MQLWAAYVLSMVFGNRCPEPLGVDAFPEQTPCLEGLLLEWSAAAIGGSKFDKHGFVLIGVLIEVSLVFWTGVFLSPGRRICVIGKETGPGPGGYG